MTQQFAHRLTFVILLICQSSICLATEIPDQNDSTKYLNAVRTFADNVLKYGRDTYGPKHTPLFVDGLNVNTHEPVKWISPTAIASRDDITTLTETEEWILSNFASQQTLLRTLHGLTEITGDPKYRDAAVQAIKYALENLRASNGLFYWGEVTAYDALGDEVRSDKDEHALKVHYPYYELMWQVSPAETKRFIEAYWSAHIIDWSNLDFNRVVINIDTLDILKTPWDHEYKGGPTFFRSKTAWACGFITTGTSLAHAATTLYRFSGQEQPLVWSRRLIQRFVDARHPNTGISPREYNRPQRSFVGGGMEEKFSDPRVGVFPNNPFVNPFTGVRSLYHLEDVRRHIWLSVLLMGEELGEQGKEFIQWAREELTAWGRASYRAKDNVFMPILTDGTSIEGIVLEKTGAGAPKGSIAEPLFADAGFFWAYATAYKTTGDTFMWQMTRDIAQGNNLGDIGETPRQTPALNRDTINSNAYNLLAFLELYNKTNQQEFLDMARRIADNIVAAKFHNGFFVPSNKHVYARFDCFEPLALLHLIAAFTSQQELMPRVWPSSPNFVAPYRHKQQGIDRRTIYTLTGIPVPSLSLQEAAAIGDVNAVKTLIESGTYIDSVEDAFQKTALHRAAISGHKDVVELLLAEGARIDAKDPPGATALHYTAEYDHKEVAELLIAKGADVNAKRGKPAGDTPLHSAARGGHKDIAELLIAKGADITTKNSYKQTPIYIARRSGNKEIVELLQARMAEISIHGAASLGILAKVKSFLGNGIDVNAKDDQGKTPLLYAVQNNQEDIVKLLVAENADVNAEEDRGETPLHAAASRGHKEIAELLLAKGADIDANKPGYTPLTWAVWNDDRDMIKLLVANGADVNFKPKNDDPAFFYCIWSDHNMELAELFLAHGARLDLKDDNSWTVLRSSVQQGNQELVEYFVSKGCEAPAFHLAASLGDLDCVKSFVEEGTDVDVKDELGWTPLFWAACMGQVEVGEFLLSKGAQADTKIKNDSTPLHKAAYTGAIRLVKLLVSKGADVNAKDNRGSTPIFDAASGGHSQVVKLLIAKGVDVNAKTQNNRTPLHQAAISGNKDVVEILIAQGANVTVKDSRGRTALDWAKQRSHSEILELLLVHHDVAVTKVSAPPSCAQGETVSIVVTLDNQGDCHEACAVKLIDATNDREIAHQPAHIHSKHRTASEADLTLTGEKGTTGSFGNWCWADGDVNGDGFNDLLITAQEYPDKVAPTDGRAYLYYGGTNMSTASAAKTFDPENTGDRLGDNSGMFADINNDNFDDVIIGSRYYGSGDEGRVYVYYGGTDMNLTPDIYLDLPSGEGTNASLGRGGLSAGDLNNDGYIDVVASAIRYPNGTMLGRVYLWYGPLASNTVVDKIFSSESDSYAFGAILSARGDVNGDNCDDLLIAHRYYPNNTGVGRAYLYWGAKGTAMDTTADVIFDCPDSGANNFGSSADLFDIDNDGCAEVIIGARNWPGDGTGEGRVYLYWGKTSGFDNTVGLIFEEQDGKAPAFGGDFVHGGYADDDQYGDLIVVAFDYNKRQSRAYLYHGSNQGGMDNVCDHTFTGDGIGFDAFRAALSDLNNDGYGDVVLAGANYPRLEGQGRCLLWYGPFETTTDITFNWNTINASIGKHTLKVEIPPVPGEQKKENNVKTVTVEVKDPSK